MGKRVKEQIGKYKKIWILAVFIVILLLVGVFMQSKLQGLLQSYMEKQVTRHASMLAELSKEKMYTELHYLENIAIYIESQSVDEKSVLAVFEETRTNSRMGLLKLGGDAIYGESLQVKEFSGIQSSFRGYSTVCHSEQKGLLFTVPVYNNGNVQYVLYELYENEFLAEEFGLSCYDGNGIVFMANRDGNIVIPSANGKVEKEFLEMEGEMEEAFIRVRERMNISTSASSIYEEENEKAYLFVAEVGAFDFLLVGSIEETYVAEGISYITILIWWVYGLLLLFLGIGLFFLFSSEEKAMESEELRKAKILADSANQAKRDFLANMSHEIRTPINAVLGMNEMIVRECQEKHINQENVREYALNMQNASKALLSLINDILDFSKIEAGKMELAEDEYQLSFLLNDVVNMVELKAQQKNLGFFVKIDENLPNILYGDMGRIRQIIVNILNNAVKYTNEGHVQLLVGQEMQNNQFVLKVMVVDTGIGIRKEDMDRLFGGFERLDIKKNRNVEGTGLGLAITDKLVELMHGTLDVESVYGMGSTFTISLPQKVIGTELLGNYKERFKEYAQNNIKYKQQFIAPNAKVLVADDNSMNLFVVEKLLQKTKVQVTTCINGEQCLKKASEDSYDVILLDHMMPGMDGIETLKALKQMKNNPSKHAAVIVLTANAIVGAKESYMKEGFDDYLSKPIDGLLLEELLKKYISKEKMIKEEEVVKMEQMNKIVKEQSDKIEDNLVEMETQEQSDKIEEDDFIVHYDEESGCELIIIDGLEEEDEDAEDLEETESGLLNHKIGLRYSMDTEEIYQEFLEIFCSIKEEKMRELTESYEAEDWANYNRLIHALKSTSKSIGGMKLSDISYELEKAARDKDSDFIHTHHMEMMELFEKTVEEALTYLG